MGGEPQVREISWLWGQGGVTGSEMTGENIRREDKTIIITNRLELRWIRDTVRLLHLMRGHLQAGKQGKQSFFVMGGGAWGPRPARGPRPSSPPPPPPPQACLKEFWGPQQNPPRTYDRRGGCAIAQLSTGGGGAGPRPARGPRDLRLTGVARTIVLLIRGSGPQKVTNPWVRTPKDDSRSAFWIIHSLYKPIWDLLK